MDRDEHLYEDDFYAWTQVQAAKLRQAADARVNLDLDFANLAVNGIPASPAGLSISNIRTNSPSARQRLVLKIP